MCADVLLPYTGHVQPDLENNAKFYLRFAEYDEVWVNIELVCNKSFEYTSSLNATIIKSVLDLFCGILLYRPQRPFFFFVKFTTYSAFHLCCHYNLQGEMSIVQISPYAIYFNLHWMGDNHFTFQFFSSRLTDIGVAQLC